MSEQFRILTARQHVRERIGMYMGSSSREDIERFVLGDWKKAQYVPALSKMVDEILDNAIDEAIRTNFKYSNKINVSIDGDKITVTDNGRGIPQDKIYDEASKEEILKADIAIEFSTPQAAVSNIKFCLENDIPIVSGTTGWLVHYDKMIKLCENRNGSFIYASNFSIGVNLFFYINEYVSNLIEPWKDYQVSIEEVHHNQKLDIPSGTAVTLAEGIIRNSDKKNWKLNGTDAENINITAKRINDIKGTHIINYNSNIDTISIKHEAHSRDGFALGAILAAEWLADKKGIFTMKDVL